MSKRNQPPATPMPGALGSTWAVFRRELRQYLHTPGTYVALSLFFILSGALFVLVMGDFVEASLRIQSGRGLEEGAMPLNVTDRVVTQLFQAINFLVLFLVPMLTMRLVADEKRSGTFELLVTTPMTDRDILLGKYFAALVVGSAVLVVCIVYPLICAVFSRPELSVVLSCYLGLLLILAAYTAFGLFASSLTDSQIAAGVIAFAGLLIFQMIGWLFKAGALGSIAAAVSVHHHSERFTRGVIDLSDVAYFILFAFAFVFLSMQVLDARRWRA